jgi:Protein of unknown function (DUF1116)
VLHGLLDREPAVVTAGIGVLYDSLAAQAVTVEPVDWRPPLDGTEAALASTMADSRREEANRIAVGRLLAASPQLVDVRPAGEILGLQRGTFLHAGPPISVDRASGPLLGALTGAMLLEGMAADPEAARARVAAGELTLEPCHHHGTVGPMAGVVTPSMWVAEIVDPVHGRQAFCPLNEGLGKVLRYGAYGPEVMDRLRWMSAVLGPALQATLRRHGPLDLKALIAQALQMGDELHNRNRAATSLFVRATAADLVECDLPTTAVADTLRFLNGNDHFFLNLAMAACKVATDAARDIPGSTMVVAMARNGTDFGIQTAGTGDRWFTGPAGVPDGLYLGGYGVEDANPDIGDSAITETAGLGGFALAAAPAIVRFVGGNAAEALTITRTMYEITLAESNAYLVPILDFRGSPVGIDVTKVVRTGILPVIDTGIAGKVAGTGQVGAGLVSPPSQVFVDAIAALGEAAERDAQGGA